MFLDILKGVLYIIKFIAVHIYVGVMSSIIFILFMFLLTLYNANTTSSYIVELYPVAQTLIFMCVILTIYYKNIYMLRN